MSKSRSQQIKLENLQNKKLETFTIKFDLFVLKRFPVLQNWLHAVVSHTQTITVKNNFLKIFQGKWELDSCQANKMGYFGTIYVTTSVQ